MKVHFSFLEVLYLAQVICCFIYFKFTDRLGYMINEDTFYKVSSLYMQPEQDDDACFVLIGIFSFLALLISMFNKNKLTILFVYLLSTFLSFLIIKKGEIDSTILNGNYILLLIMLVIGVLTIYFLYLLIRRVFKLK